MQDEKLVKSYEDAIDCLNKNKPTSGYYMLQESVDIAIKALEEVQQYRQIGTVEECREAVEKQTAKKVKSISPVKDGDSYVGLIGRCPCCGDILEEDTVYCDCGQRLDWGGMKNERRT